MTDSKPKDTIVTISISPLKDGKRKVLISGAPEQEMPIVRVGQFQDLHRLLDDVWIDLQKRKPQAVTVKAENQKKAKPASTKDDEGAEGNGVPAEENVEEGDQLVTPAPAPADLPVIEGDTTAKEEQLSLLGGETNG